MNVTPAELITVPFHLRVLVPAIERIDWTDAEANETQDKMNGLAKDRTTYEVRPLIDAKKECQRILLMRQRMAEHERQFQKCLNQHDPREIQWQDVIPGMKVPEVRT